MTTKLSMFELELLEHPGPKPWEDGDERCHCTHCQFCGRLFRTDEVEAHVAIEQARHKAFPVLLGMAKLLVEIESQHIDPLDDELKQQRSAEGA